MNKIRDDYINRFPLFGSCIHSGNFELANRKSIIATMPSSVEEIRWLRAFLRRGFQYCGRDILGDNYRWTKAAYAIVFLLAFVGVSLAWSAVNSMHHGDSSMLYITVAYSFGQAQVNDK